MIELILFNIVLLVIVQSGFALAGLIARTALSSRNL